MYDSNKTHRSLHEAALGIIRPAAPLEEVTLNEDHGRRTPDVTKSLKLVTGLDAEEMECFLFDLSEYFELEAIDYDEDTANPDFVKLSKTLQIAARGWQKRSGN